MVNHVKPGLLMVLKKFVLLLFIAFAIGLFQFQNGFCSCQQLGEYCGSPATETFPACCPFYTNGEGQQVSLKCLNVDNGVGTCEISNEGGSSSGEN